MEEQNEILGLNEYGSIASIFGFIFSFISLIFVHVVNRKIQKIRQSHLFNSTISAHLEKIDTLQKKLISNIPDIETNENEIKEILVGVLTSFESMLPNLHDRKAHRKTKKLIKRIDKFKKRAFYNKVENLNQLSAIVVMKYNRVLLNKCSSKEIEALYILINENYNRIEYVKLNKTASNI